MTALHLKHPFSLSFASLLALSLAVGACGGEEEDAPSYDDDPTEHTDGGTTPGKPDAGGSDGGEGQDEDTWPLNPEDAYAAFYKAMPEGAAFKIRKSDSRSPTLLAKGKDGSITLATMYAPESTTCAGLVENRGWQAWQGHTNYWVIHGTEEVKVDGKRVEVDDWTAMTLESPDLDPATNPLHLTLHNNYGSASVSSIQSLEKMLELSSEFEETLGNFMISSSAKNNALATGEVETIAGLQCTVYRWESLMDTAEWCVHEETGLTLRYQLTYTYGEAPKVDTSTQFTVSEAAFDLTSADDVFQRYGKFCKVIDETTRPKTLADVPKVTQGIQGQGWAPIPQGYIPWKHEGIDFVTLIREKGNGIVHSIHAQFLPGLEMMDQINEYILDLVKGGQKETKDSMGCQYQSVLGTCQWDFTGAKEDTSENYYNYQIKSHSVLEGLYTKPAEPYSITAQYVVHIDA